MKQSGFLYELRPTDYILGSTSPLKGVELLPSGDWVPYKPADEKQFNATFDTMSCTTFSGTSKLETMFNLLLGQGKFAKEQLDFLTKEGYIEDGKFNFSDRFSAIMSGTMTQGNYFQNVWDSFRKDGLIPERDFPFGGKNWNEYHDKKNITQTMKDKALKFLDMILEKDEAGKYKLNYEWVPITNTQIELSEAFKQAPIQVAVTKENPQHAILLLKMDTEFETYEPYLRPRTRSVAYALKAVIKIKEMKKKYKYFTEKEVEGLKPELVEMLDKAREIAGIPFVLTSTLRSPEVNEDVGGVSNSAHITGQAVDIRVRNSNERFRILKSLIEVGFTRIGVAKTFCHADIDKSKPANVTWLY